jgi:hypothetical protein
MACRPGLVNGARHAWTYAISIGHGAVPGTFQSQHIRQCRWCCLVEQQHPDCCWRAAARTEAQ